MLVAILLVLTLGYQALILWRGQLMAGWRIGFAARHLRWASGLWLGYGLPALLGLAAIGGMGAIGGMPLAFLPLAQTLGLPPGAIAPTTIALGLAGGSALGLALTWWRARRGRGPWTIGDASSLLPRRDGDLWPAAVLAISAGVTEELFFRLWLPLIVTLACGSGAVGMGVGTAAFAAMHRYQGWAGMAANLVGGALLAALYMGTGSLWVAIAVHALVDLNALVLRPWVASRVRRVG
ncbi:CPBP family intramembrane glutamic endopeptidase [uncultured Sphingomonas sp.]|uniref:CPBP family intramembrane glutamic endopeptidase n=1 Tax=uncultured Sphingomonas sp. TaxID=158754 RepID=UPI0025F94BB9|nr:CPBP family intramembrane glutamic endopeptidase [uncultured Sphingomonas sp.]